MSRANKTDKKKKSQSSPLKSDDDDDCHNCVKLLEKIQQQQYMIQQQQEMIKLMNERLQSLENALLKLSNKDNDKNKNASQTSSENSDKIKAVREQLEERTK